MKSEKISYKILAGLSIVLALLVLGLSGYIVYDKFINNEENGEPSIETTGVTLDVTGNLVSSLEEKLGSVSVLETTYDKQPTNILYEAPQIFNETENDKKLAFILNRINCDEIVADGIFGCYSFDVEETYQEIFGSSVPLQHQDIHIHSSYEYESEKGYYINSTLTNGVGFGDTFDRAFTYVKTIGAKQYSDRIEIEQKALYVVADYKENSSYQFYIFDLYDRMSEKILKEVTTNDNTYEIVDTTKSIYSFNSNDNTDYKSLITLYDPDYPKLDYRNTILGEQLLSDNIDSLGTYTFIFKKDAQNNYYIYEVKYNKES
ncbi:MAG: hypothetical protein PHD02_04155 [Bacilli bacterium]|nr:hypothetical protein [Bacilli bacterium]